MINLFPVIVNPFSKFNPTEEAETFIICGLMDTGGAGSGSGSVGTRGSGGGGGGGGGDGGGGRRKEGVAMERRRASRRRRAVAFARVVFRDARPNPQGQLSRVDVRRYFKTHPIENAHMMGTSFTWRVFFESLRRAALQADRDIAGTTGTSIDGHGPAGGGGGVAGRAGRAGRARTAFGSAGSDGGRYFGVTSFIDAVAAVYHDELYTPVNLAERRALRAALQVRRTIEEEAAIVNTTRAMADAETRCVLLFTFYVLRFSFYVLRFTFTF